VIVAILLQLLQKPFLSSNYPLSASRATKASRTDDSRWRKNLNIIPGVQILFQLLACDSHLDAVNLSDDVISMPEIVFFTQILNPNYNLKLKWLHYDIL